MPPKKKAKTNGVTLYDFLYVLTELSNLYEKQGDERKAKSFAAAAPNNRANNRVRRLSAQKGVKARRRDRRNIRET